MYDSVGAPAYECFVPMCAATAVTSFFLSDPGAYWMVMLFSSESFLIHKGLGPPLLAVRPCVEHKDITTRARKLFTQCNELTAQIAAKTVQATLEQARPKANNVKTFRVSEMT